MQTDYGWVGIHHTRIRCDNSEDDQDFWRVVGFNDDADESFGLVMRRFGRSGTRVECDSCELDIPLGGEVDGLHIDFWSPFWMRITVTGEQDVEAWDYLISRDDDTKAITTAPCKEHGSRVTKVAVGSPDIAECLGTIGDGYWEETAARLRNHSIFDEQAIDWIADHRTRPPV